jgi:hypothetical protein
MCKFFTTPLPVLWAVAVAFAFYCGGVAVGNVLFPGPAPWFFEVIPAGR